MAVDWDAINDKLGDALTNIKTDDILISERTTAQGVSVKFRTAAEIAQFQTIARNQAAADDRDSEGLMSRIEMDPLE